MEILISAKNIISTILALLLLPITIMMPPTESYEAKNPDELKTSFTVLSDIHIEGNKYSTFEKFTEILKDVKGAKDNDTLVFLGDNTMNGQDIESIFFYVALKAANPADNLVIAPGNHDYGNGTGAYDELKGRFKRYANFVGCDIGDNNYYYKVIDDCYFIVLTTESDTVNDVDISDAQLSWLKDVLDKASAEGKYAFVFNHHPVNYIKNGDHTRLSALLNDYEDLIYFSGHTHSPLREYSVSVVDGVQQFNIPRTTDDDYEGNAGGIGAVVEVYEDEVLVRFRDFDDSEWVEGYEYTFAY